MFVGVRRMLADSQAFVESQARKTAKTLPIKASKKLDAKSCVGLVGVLRLSAVHRSLGPPSTLGSASPTQGRAASCPDSGGAAVRMPVVSLKQLLEAAL